jgi:hypothetical protein
MTTHDIVVRELERLRSKVTTLETDLTSAREALLAALQREDFTLARQWLAEHPAQEEG